jgi:hypothetical protein
LLGSSELLGMGAFYEVPRVLLRHWAQVSLQVQIVQIFENAWRCLGFEFG